MDARTIEPGQWFLAIAGDNFDAHDFVTLELCKSGCVGVIGNRVCENRDMGFVQIDGDTVISLVKMATFARSRFLGEVIAVTGSVGKTSTKAMIALSLESLKSRIYQIYGNWNNRIGVALSLIDISRNVGIAILETEMSRKGEILELARMGRPDVRVILNVGASHLEKLGSLEEVAMAKGEILQEAKPGDICVVNADDPLVTSLPVHRGVRSGGVCDFWSGYVPFSMRSEFVVAKSGIKIVNDVFSANPVSTKAAIDMLKSIDCTGKRFLFLGTFGIAGKKFNVAAEKMNLIKKINIVHAVDAENLVPKILKCLNINDVVLVMGSRSMQMEKVVDALKAMHRFILHVRRTGIED
ncbi:hypothetical protein CRYUN_Cryun10bG0084100 [Craigia yunnanensis]